MVAQIKVLEAENERLVRAWKAKHEDSVSKEKHANELIEKLQNRIRELEADLVVAEEEISDLHIDLAGEHI